MLRRQPVQVSGLTGVVAIAAGAAHSLALKEDGTVVAWGAKCVRAARRQYEYSASDARHKSSSLSTAVDIAAGGFHSLAVLSSGECARLGGESQGTTRRRHTDQP